MEKYCEFIIVGDIGMTIEKQNNESREMLMERISIIRNNFNNYKNKFDYLLNLTKIYINNKYLHCEYNENIMDEINKLKLYE